MIKAHCESSFAIEEGADGERGSMMRMFVGSGHAAAGGSPKTKHHCEHCDKGCHTACKDGKLLFRELMVVFNGGEGSGRGIWIAEKCHIYKKTD